MFSIYQNVGQQSFTHGEVRPYACAEVRPLWLCIYGGAEESRRRQTSQGARPVRICLWHGDVEAQGWGKNKCFKENLLFWKHHIWKVETSNRVFPSVGQKQSKLLRWAIQVLNPPISKILINLCDYVKVEVQKTEGPERRVYHQNLLTSRHSFHLKIYFKL